MTNKQLFKIGEVAKMFNISMGTLRHYEQNGLLTPEYIDDNTGYRYYGVKQFEVLNTIRYLRVLGLPLTEIADFLKNRDVCVIEQKLKAQKDIIERKKQELELISKKIDNRLEMLKDASDSELDTICIKEFKKIRIVKIKDSLKLNSYLDLEYSIRKLQNNQEDSLVFLGKVGVGISKESLCKGNYKDYELVFLILDREDTYNGEVQVLKESKCVTIRFRGSHNDSSYYYKLLLDYINQNNLKISGFSREITLIDYGITNDINKFVTEIAIPVVSL